MSSGLLTTLRHIVRDEVARLRFAELAVVQEIHPHASDSDKDNYACTVVLRGSDLVLRQVPVATPRIGLATIPAEGDLVLVQFIGGDVNAPVITGSLYNDEDRPPVNDDGQISLHLPLGTDDAEAVRLTVASVEERSLALNLGSGLEVQLKDDDPVIVLSVDGGKAELTIARDGGVEVSSKGDLKLTANNLTVEGTEITIEGKSELKLKGGVVKLN
jgi:phage baseplate assembly protein gpV